jgi:hypothetical protein
MLKIHDQVYTAARARVSRQLDTGATLGDAMMNAVRQYANLNLNMARATLEQGNFVVRQQVSARDYPQFFSLAVAQVQSNVLRAFDYGYYLTSITADTQTHVIRGAGDGFAETNREWIELAGTAAESGRYGWKTAVALFRDLASTFQSLLRTDVPQGTAAPHVAFAGRARMYR